MNKKKVKLTLMRHGAYNKSEKFPINNDAIIMSYIMGFELQTRQGNIDCVYAGDLERSIFTAQCVIKGAQIPCTVLSDCRLSEETYRQDALEFIEELKIKAKEENLSHVVIVTSIITFLHLGYSDNIEIVPNFCVTYEGNDWETLVLSNDTIINDTQEFPPYTLGIQNHLKETISDFSDFNKVIEEIDGFFDQPYYKGIRERNK